MFSMFSFMIKFLHSSAVGGKNNRRLPSDNTPIGRAAGYGVSCVRIICAVHTGFVVSLRHFAGAPGDHRMRHKRTMQKSLQKSSVLCSGGKVMPKKRLVYAKEKPRRARNGASCGGGQKRSLTVREMRPISLARLDAHNAG